MREKKMPASQPNGVFILKDHRGLGEVDKDHNVHSAIVCTIHNYIRGGSGANPHTAENPSIVSDCSQTGTISFTNNTE